MSINRNDLAAGAIFAGLGLFYGVTTVSTLPIGRALRMGSGYFPIVLSGAMVVLGVAIMVQSLTSGSGKPFGRIPWRGMIAITGAIVIFAASLANAGLAPTTFGATAIACLANKEMSLKSLVLVSAVVAAFCTLIFGYAVRLPVPIVGPWLGG